MQLVVVESEPIGASLDAFPALYEAADHYAVRDLRRFACAAVRAASISESMFSRPLPS